MVEKGDGRSGEGGCLYPLRAVLSSTLLWGGGGGGGGSMVEKGDGRSGEGGCLYPLRAVLSPRDCRLRRVVCVTLMHIH